MDGMSELKGLPPDAKPDDDSNEKLSTAAKKLMMTKTKRVW